MPTTELRDRTFLVTGTTSGIGRATAELLAARRATVILAARSEARNQAVIDEIRRRDPAARVEGLTLDVSELGSVRQAAAAFLASGRPLDVLINNAGIAYTHALTTDAFDLTYATNHLGPFLLTSLLLPRLQQAPQGRIVNVASEAHQQIRQFDWSLLERRTTATTSGFRDYGITKLMNILHARELARRLADTRISSYALHPGVVASNVWRRLPAPLQWLVKKFMLTNEEGSATTLYCATAAELSSTSGRYYNKGKEASPSRVAMDDALARELWDRSERLTGS